MTSPSLRPAIDEDIPFLLSLYAETRATEMLMVPWNDDQKHAFVEAQFKAQNDHYREQFPNAAFDIIISDRHPVGRLYVLRKPDQIRILDLHIASEARANGLGSHFITDLKAEAAAVKKPLRIYLEINNPYKSAFERRGFAGIQTLNDFHVLMEWRATS